MLNCILIGAGYIASNHADALIANKSTNVVGVICRDPEHAAALVDKFGEGCRYYPTLEEACADNKVDFVDICTPTQSHEFYTLKAASLGCHVLCEKPITFTMESLETMIRACCEAGVKLMAAQVVRFMSEPTKIRELIKSGTLGDIHFFYEKRLCRHPSWGTWHRDPSISGGGLYDLNIHDIDFLYSIFGMPNTVYAAGWKSPSGCWNHVATTLTWDDAKAVCETSLEMTGSFPFSVEQRCTGDKGTVVYLLSAGENLNDSCVQTSFAFYPEGSETPEIVKSEELNGFNGEIDAFVDAIENGKEVPISVCELKDVLRIIIATKQSLEENVLVTL